MLSFGLAGCASDTKTEAATSAETATTTTTTEAPTTSAQASGPIYTIVDYIKDNGITETPIHRGDPGSPTVNLPFPPGWDSTLGGFDAWQMGGSYMKDGTKRMIAQTTVVFPGRTASMCCSSTPTASRTRWGR